jgi:hypothetical protein
MTIKMFDLYQVSPSVPFTLTYYLEVCKMQIPNCANCFSMYYKIINKQHSTVTQLWLYMKLGYWTPYKVMKTWAKWHNSICRTWNLSLCIFILDFDPHFAIWLGSTFFTLPLTGKQIRLVCKVIKHPNLRIIHINWLINILNKNLSFFFPQILGRNWGRVDRAGCGWGILLELGRGIWSEKDE